MPRRAFSYRVLTLALLTLLVANGVLAQPKGPPEKPGLATYDVFHEGDTLHVLLGHGTKRPAALTLWHRRSSDGGKTWSPAVRVNAAGDGVLAPHPGENPQIAASGERLIALWTGPSPDGGRAGPIVTALSSDGGRTWQAGPNPAPGSKRYHGLLEIGKASDAFHLVWLHQEEGKQALHYARSADAGRTWSPRRLLADATCNCCWNSVATMPDGSLHVLYRGATPRDMMLVSGADGSPWRYRGAVGRFDWDFAGCPHVGGALAVGASGKALHALVWTGREGAVGLHHLVSTSGGAKWSAPKRLGGDAARNADLASSSDGTLAAAWDALEETNVVYRSLSRDGGATWSTPERLSTPGLHASHPRIVWASGAFATFWLESIAGEGAELKVNGRAITVPVPGAVAHAPKK